MRVVLAWATDRRAGARQPTGSLSAPSDRTGTRTRDALPMPGAPLGRGRRRHIKERLLPTRRASSDVTLFPRASKAFPQLRHPQLDSGLHGAEWLIQPCGNFHVRKPFIIRQFDRLLLRWRKAVYGIAHCDAKLLIGLCLVRAWSQIRHAGRDRFIQLQGGVLATNGPCAETIERTAPSQSNQPGTRRPAPDVVSGDFAPHLEIHVLEEFCGFISITQYAKGQCAQQGAGVVIELSKRLLVAFDNACEQSRVD